MNLVAIAGLVLPERFRATAGPAYWPLVRGDQLGSGSNIGTASMARSKVATERQYFGGNRGFCNASLYYAANVAEHPLSETPRSPAVAAADMSSMSAIGVKRTSRGRAAMSANDPKRSTNRCDRQKAGRRRRDLRRARTVPMTARPCKRSTARYGRENTTVQRPESAIEFPIGRTSRGDTGCPKAPSRCNRTN
jgi:hypothetical protein